MRNKLLSYFSSCLLDPGDIQKDKGDSEATGGRDGSKHASVFPCRVSQSPFWTVPMSQYN